MHDNRVRNGQGTRVRATDHKYHTLDGIRGVAALAVLCFHLRNWVSHHYFFPGAYLAVDLFFALSGFVIALAYDRRLAGSMTFRQFLAARAIRLQPMIVLAAALGAGLAFYQTPRYGVFITFLSGAVFLPDPRYGFFFNQPAWSLFYEMLINLAFAATFAFWTVRRLSVLIALAGSGLVAGIAWLGNADHGLIFTEAPIALARVTFSFAVGVVLCRTRETWLARIPVIRPALLLMIVPLATLLPFTGRARTIYDIAFILLLSPMIVACGIRARALEGGRIDRPLIFLGFLSYPLYALHAPIKHWIADLLPDLAGGSATILVMLLSVAAALIAGRYYDAPIRKWLTARIFPRPATTRRGLGPATDPAPASSVGGNKDRATRMARR